MTWTAFYCPNCSAAVNEADLECDNPDIMVPMHGSFYTCGYCKVRTNDWNHVKRCRHLIKTIVREKNERERAEAQATVLQIYADLVART